MKGLLLIINLYTVAGSIRVRLLLVGDGRKGKIPISLTSHFSSRFNAKFIPWGSVVNSRAGQVLPATYPT